MKDVTDMIDALRRRGPIDEAECLRTEGPTPSPSLVRSALQQLSGEDGWGGYRFYCSVLERCGCHPEEGHSTRLVNANEAARQVLIRNPGSREQVEAMMAGK